MLWASLELKEPRDPRALTDAKAQEVNKVLQECLEPGAYKDLLEIPGSQVSQDSKAHQDFLVLLADQELKVNQELQAVS